MLEPAEEKTELTTRIHQQEIVARLGLDALTGMDLHELMNDACHLVCDSLKADYCKVVELLPDRHAFLVKAGRGWEEGIVGTAMIPNGLQSQSGYTVLLKEPVIVEDTKTESRFETAQLLVDHGVVSGVSVLVHSGKDVFGAFGVHTTTKRSFTKDDIYFLQSVA